MDLLIASVLASAIAPAPSERPASSNQPVESAKSTSETTTSDTTTSQGTEPTANPSQITCPPGQFASAFSDVYPTDWAYQAVNNLASTPQQCFNLPE